MAQIIIPMINQQYSADFSADAADTAVYIKQTYLSYIMAAAQNLGIDYNWIIGFMIIESGTGNGSVNPNAMSPALAYGLLQLQPQTAYDTITNQAPVMTGQMSVVIQRYLPGFIKIGGFTGFYSAWKDKITAALKQPEFNIWVGATQLAQLMSYIIKKTGSLKMDQVVVAYNAGQGNYQKYVYKKGLATVDTTALVAAFPFAETRNYILKLVGIDGSMMAALRAS